MKGLKAISLVFFLLIQIASHGVHEQIHSPNDEMALEPLNKIFQSGNNSSSNNSGGNNTSNDSHCLILTNFSMSQTYYVNLELVNICNKSLNYPGVNASSNNSNVYGFLNYTNWFYMIPANSTYNMSWQLSFNQSLTSSTSITINFEAAILNCGANGSWHDCPTSNLSHTFTYTPPLIRLVILSTSFYNNSNDVISLTYRSENYTGYVNWNYTSTNGTVSNTSTYSSSSARTAYLYPQVFGSIQICGTIANIASACTTIQRSIRTLQGSILSPLTNLSTNQSIVNVQYFGSNYLSGTVTLNQQVIHYLPTYVPNQIGTTVTNLSSLYMSIPYGWSTICLELQGDNYTTLSDCVSVYRIPPVVRLVIQSVWIDSNLSNYISISYYSENYTGYVNWNYTSLNGTVSTTTSYTSFSTRTTYLYPQVFGLIHICGSIQNITTECTTIYRDVRSLQGSILSPSTNYSTNLNYLTVEYFANNYTNGSLTLNQQTIHTIPTFIPNHNGTSSNNSMSHTISLPTGWSTICLTLYGDNYSTLSDCISVYRIPPVVRFIIESASLNNSQNNAITITYRSENYSGYVNWTYTAPNGSFSNTSSYTSSSTRTTYLYPQAFGSIQICGSIANFSTDCVSLYRYARTVEGEIISPSNNFQTNNDAVTLHYIANNFSVGLISVNGVAYVNLGYNSFNLNATSGSSTVYLGYGNSLVCLHLTGEDGTTITDCRSIERIVPLHQVSITYPMSNTNFIGHTLSLSFVLQNSSRHYFTSNGLTLNGSNNSGNGVALNTGYGTHTVCVVSFDFANQMDSDCIVVSMQNPNTDTDGDGISDISDICQNTPNGEAVDAFGCSASQMDTDNDGVVDSLDVCPSTQQFMIVDSSGCSAFQRDSDNDGVLDSNDLCQLTPPNSVVNANGCSNTQIDSDNDGVMDGFDLCPNTIVGSQVNSDGCASSQLDSDSDGIVDSFDQCPNTTSGTVVDQTGCAYINSGSNSTGNTSPGSSDSNGLPGFEPVLLVTSVLVAFFVTGRRKNLE